jgi:hypothetical protein
MGVPSPNQAGWSSFGAVAAMWSRLISHNAGPHALAELATHERAAVVPELLARVQVRYPCVPIVFCDSRALAEESTFRLLGAALAHHEAEHHNNPHDRQ